MPPNDVVSHKLSLDLGKRRDSNAEGIELPVDFIGRKRAVPAKPPATVEITGQVLREKPYRSVGRMELRFDPLFDLKFASGWVVAPRAFITAGHCVWHKKYGGWIYGAKFCPRFAVDCEKEFTVETVYTLQGWIDSEGTERQYDLAACVVTERFTDAEPPLPFRLGEPGVDYAAVGYPTKPTSRHDFNGKHMWQATGETIDLDGNTYVMENDLTGGASGGPWLDLNDDEKVNGITASRANDDPNAARSPIFGQGFQNLYDAVKHL